jgi:tetratricopeptide (TPR) repeat protein
MLLAPQRTLTLFFALFLGVSGRSPAFAAAAAPQREAPPAPEAWAALERGDAAKAAAIFRTEIDRNPRSAPLHFGAGYAAYVLGRNDAAISALKRAVEYDPKLLPALLLLGQVAYSSGDLDLAIRSFEKANALNPGDQQVIQQLEHWKRESTLHRSFAERPGVRFHILFEGTTDHAISARVERVLESVYWNIGKTLNSYPTETLTVILYTNRQFRDITRAPAWAGGGYDGRIRLAVGGAMRSTETLDRVVTHEFVHAVVANIAPRGVPTWVHEGLAGYFDSADHTWATRVLRAADELIPLKDLADGFGELDGPTALVAYAESLVAAQILCAQLGQNVGIFIQMLGSGHSVDQALSTLGVRPEAFHAEWRRKVGVKARATAKR